MKSLSRTRGRRARGGDMARTGPLSVRSGLVVAVAVSAIGLTGISAAAAVDCPLRVPQSPAAGRDGSFGAALSADGRYVAFQSYDNKLVPGDTNNDADVFRADRATGKIVRVSLGVQGAQLNLGAFGASISADGNR